MRFAVISVGYLLAAGWVLGELVAHRAARQSYWICLALLGIGWAWAIYSAATLRPPSPLEAIEAVMQRAQWLSPWVSE